MKNTLFLFLYFFYMHIYSEKEQRLTVLLKNAEISQELAMLKTKIKNDNAETMELTEQLKALEFMVAEK